MSSFNLIEQSLTFGAAESLANAQYLFCVLDSATGYVKLPTALNEWAIGVITNVPSDSSSDGTTFEQHSPVVCLNGITKLAVVAPCTAGTFLAADYDGTNSGYGIAFDGTNIPRAIALQPALTAGDVIAVKLIDGKATASLY